MIKSRRFQIGFIYFLSVVSLLAVRILFSAGVFGNLSSDSSSRVFTVLVQTVCMGVIPVLGFLALVKSEKKNPMKELVLGFGFSKRVSRENWLRTILIGFIMMFTATFVANIWNNVLGWFGYKPSVSTPTNYYDIGVLFVEILMVAVYPAVFEEITHRGFLFAGYRKDLGVKVVFLTAMLFALMHQNIRQTGYTFYDGIIMGLAVYYTGSIYPAMLIHFMNNLGVVLGEYAAQNGGIYRLVNIMYNVLLGTPLGKGVYFVLAIIALCCLVALFAGMRKSTRRLIKIKLFDADIWVNENFELARDVYGKKPKKHTLGDDIFLYAAIFLGVVSTLFTFVWGILR